MRTRIAPSRRASICLYLAVGWFAVLGATARFVSAAETAARPAFAVQEVNPPVPGKVGFVEVTSESTGLHFTNFVAAARHLTNQIILNGSGVAAGDVDGDGWCDLFFCGLSGGSRLYRNLGEWKFQDVTAIAGLDLSRLDASGAALVDTDGDGDLDLLISSYGDGTHLFLNDGRGHFTEMTPALNGGRCGLSFALADMDGDGDLDLYQANYRLLTLRDQPNTRFSIKVIDGKPQVVSINNHPLTDPEYTNRFNFRISMEGGTGRLSNEEQGEPDVLFRNEGGGRFAPVSFTDGTFRDEDGRPLAKPPFDWGQSVQFRDLNGDGAPDLYICDDFRSEDRIWLNDGHGGFQAAPRLAFRNTSLSAMGLDVADINRDGHYDIFITDMLSPDPIRRQTQRIDMSPEILPPGAIENRPQYSRNTLHVSRGDGTFAEVAQLSGVEATDWAWTPIFLDVDLDGYEDLLVANGFERDGMHVDTLQRISELKKQGKLSSLEQLELRRLFPRLATPNLAYRNLGDLRFEDMSHAWGFDLAEISQGMAAADLDNDGDLDIVINNFNAGATLLRNDGAAPRVGVRLKGRAPNTQGIGAQIKLLGGAVPVQMQEMIAGGRYLSSDDAMRVFAAGSPTNTMRLEVTWRSGVRSVVEGVRANRIYTVDESGARSVPADKVATPPPLFADVSERIGHSHHDEDFDDFARQPTLSRRFSQLGPGVSWFDVDGDGWDDLLVSSGRGGRMAGYRNNGRGGFESLTNAPFDRVVSRDQTAVLGFSRPDGLRQILAGSANYEDGLSNGPVAAIYDFVTGRCDESLPGQESSTGPLALADYDGDGDLDLFVGGRIVPGRYALPASSLLFLQEDGKFVPDAVNTPLLAGLGLVSGAVFTDLDGDGYAELVLACDWGSIRIFRNDHGKLKAWNPSISFGGSPSVLHPQPTNLLNLNGCWNGVAAGDFDGDGRMDLLASNWGRNTKYERFRIQPVRAYTADFDGDGTVEFIQGHYLATTGTWAPIQSFHVLGTAMPLIREAVGTWENYSKLSLDALFSDALKVAPMVEVSHPETTLFLNRGEHFEVRVLPTEAQMSPAFGVTVADFDGDGNEDAFLSQNCFAVHPDTSRYDAGRGLLLQGDGRGGLMPLSAAQSGLRIYGEQRGSAAGDFDGDGRVDLVVGQNAAPTILFRNSSARPGLRLRLAGPPGNRQAVGALVRLVTKEGQGPAREMHAGSGYWSQDSAVAVLAVPARSVAVKVSVQWPGGHKTTHEIPVGSRELRLDATGTTERLQ